MKYKDLKCPKCNKETLHRTRRRMAPGRKGSGAYEKYEAKHCLVCNHYWGYSKPKSRGATRISLR